MKIKRGTRPWRLKIAVEGERARKIVSFLNKYGIEITALIAFLALVVGTLTIFVAPWLQWLRWILSLMTFVAAVVTTGQPITVNVPPETVTVSGGEPVIKTGSEDED